MLLLIDRASQSVSPLVQLGLSILTPGSFVLTVPLVNQLVLVPRN